MCNNSSCKIAEIGTIKIKMFNGIIQTLIDVRHILDLKRHLISLSTFDLNRYKFIGESGVINVSKCAFVVMKGKKQYSRLYILQGSIVTSVVVSTYFLSNTDIAQLWHMHLEHMSEIGID